VELENYPAGYFEYAIAREALVKLSLVTFEQELRILRMYCAVQDMVHRMVKKSEHFSNMLNSAAVLLSAVWPYSDTQNLN
jgi:hypothetical protein